MKKYLAIFNFQTLLVVSLALLSCYLSLRFHLQIYSDFLIIAIVIVFPFTFFMREAFKKRERSIQYLGLFNSPLHAVFYSFKNSRLDAPGKAVFGLIAYNVSQSLQQYLPDSSQDTAALDKPSHAIAIFIHHHRKKTKKISLKLLLFVSKINESIGYLLAVRRHYTPWSPRMIVLFAIYMFCIFYPASILTKTGFDLPVWNLLF